MLNLNLKRELNYLKRKPMIEFPKEIKQTILNEIPLSVEREIAYNFYCAVDYEKITTNITKVSSSGKARKLGKSAYQMVKHELEETGELFNVSETMKASRLLERYSYPAKADKTDKDFKTVAIEIFDTLMERYFYSTMNDVLEHLEEKARNHTGKKLNFSYTIDKKSKNVLLDKKTFKQVNDIVSDFLMDELAQEVELELNKSFNKKLLPIINRNIKWVTEELLEETFESLKYTYHQRKEIHKYVDIEKSFLEFAELNSAYRFRPGIDELLKKANAWAKTKSFEEIELFDEYYPKDEIYKDFGWLDNATLLKKNEEAIAGDAAVHDLMSSIDVSDEIYDENEEKFSTFINFIEEIFKLDGKKIITIVAGKNMSDDIYAFEIDEFNRVGSDYEAYQDFISLVLESFMDGGSVTVRQIKTTLPPINVATSIDMKKNQIVAKRMPNKENSKTVVNLYGAMLHMAQYAGLTKEQLKKCSTVNLATHKKVTPDKGINYLFWNIDSNEDFADAVRNPGH